MLVCIITGQVLAMMTRRYESAELQRYFEAEVVPEKEETKRIIAVLKPDLDNLFQLIKNYDKRLYQHVAHVGSYYQGLKVSVVKFVLTTQILCTAFDTVLKYSF